MSQIHDRITVSPVELAMRGNQPVILDVRKPAARMASGLKIPGSLWRHPFDALTWAEEFKPGKAVVYCVQGHEVSMAVSGFLRDCGVDAAMLEGGFEAWRAAGLPVEPLERGDA